MCYAPTNAALSKAFSWQLESLFMNQEKKVVKAEFDLIFCRITKYIYS